MSPQPSRRRGTPITLAVTTADRDDDVDPGWADREQVLPPVLAGVLGGVTAAAAGWVLVAGFFVAGWLTARVGTLPEALATSVQAWLAGHGAGFMVGGTRWTVIPLGLTLVLMVILHAVAGFAARQYVVGEAAPSVATRARAARRATGLVTLGYVLMVVLAAVLFGTGEQVARGFLGAGAIALIASWLGAARAVRLRWLTALPRPWPTVIRATAVAIGVLLILGLALLVAAIITHWERINGLAMSLDAGPAGNMLLWVAQASFAPNIILWCGSWLLGAGFTFGVDTVISPSLTELGLLPGIPVVGALPSEGPGAIYPLWWLIAGVLAGVASTIVVLRRRPQARFDETAVLGALSGVVAGLAFVGLAALTRGDLGVERLVGVGPRLLELLVMAVSVLGISGLLSGLVVGLVRLRSGGGEPTVPEQESD